jgi:cyclase
MTRKFRREIAIKAWVFGFCFAMSSGLLSADSVDTHQRSVNRVADGVYMIRHPDAPNGFPNGNTTVIVGSNAALVVDSCYLPSEARKDIAQIREWTDKPVRYLVNTHWHNDHVMGNGTYAESFPVISVVSQIETKNQMQGYVSFASNRLTNRISTLQEILRNDKDADGKELIEDRKKQIEQELSLLPAILKDWNSVAMRVPDITFDRELSIDLGDREVQMKFLGRGNTNGDAIVYLPKEKVVIAGDLLDHPVPYLGGGFPSELLTTLQAMSQLEIDSIVPGHGELLKRELAKEHLKNVKSFLKVILENVHKEVYRLGNSASNLDAVKQSVLNNTDIGFWHQRFCGSAQENIEFFDNFSLPGVITAAYREFWGN